MVENGLVCVWRVIYVRYVISLPRKREMERREKRELYQYLVSRYYILYTQINFFNSAAKRGKRAEQQKGLLCRRVLS